MILKVMRELRSTYYECDVLERELDSENKKCRLFLGNSGKTPHNLELDLSENVTVYLMDNSGKTVEVIGRWKKR